MSIHDEQEIYRLRSVNEELRLALANSEMQLREAMWLLARSEGWQRDRLNAQIYRNRLHDLEKRYYNYK